MDEARKSPIDSILCFLLYSLLLLTPLVVVFSFHQPFIIGKHTFLGFALLAAAMAWIFPIGFRRRILLPGGTFGRIFALFILWQLVTFIWSHSFQLSLHAWALQFAFFAFFVFVSTSLRENKQLERFLLCPIIAALGVSSLALLQYYQLDFSVLPHLRISGFFDLGQLVMLQRSETHVKIYSLLGHRNYVAGYLMAILPLILSFFVVSLLRQLENRGSKKNVALMLLLLLALLLSLATVVLTHTRGSWVGLFCGLSFWGFFLCWPMKKDGLRGKGIHLLSLVLLLSLVVAFLPRANRMKHSTVSRIKSTFNLKAGSVNERRLLLRTAWKMICANVPNFLFGRGIGTYVVHHGFYQAKVFKADDGEGFWRMANKSWYVHNELLNFWAETGLVGVSLILSFLYCLLHCAIVFLNGDGNLEKRLLVLGASASIVAVIIHNLFTFSLHLPSTGLLFYGLAAIVVSTAKKPKVFRLPPPVACLSVAISCFAALFIANALANTVKTQLVWHEARNRAGEGQKLPTVVKLKRAMNSGGKNIDLYYDYAQALQNAGRLKKSRSIYSAIRGLFVDAAVDYNVANIYRAQGKMEEAVKHYKMALALSPAHGGSLYWLSRLHIKDGRWQEAYALLQKGVKHNHYDVNLALTAGLVAFVLDFEEDMKEYFALVKRIEKKDKRKKALADLVPALKETADGGVALLAKLSKQQPNDWFIQELAKKVRRGSQ